GLSLAARKDKAVIVDRLNGQRLHLDGVMKLLRRDRRRGLSFGGCRRDIGGGQPKSDTRGRKRSTETGNEVPMKEGHSPGDAGAPSLKQNEASQIQEQKYDQAETYLGGGIAAERGI